MPIFEYKCDNCQTVTPFLEKHNAKNNRKCSNCGSENLKKQFSTFAPRVKQSAGNTKCQACPSGHTCPNAQL